MAYIEIKKIKGKGYRYLRKTVRENGRFKKVALKYLGPVEPIYGINKKRKTNASLYAKQITEKEKVELQKALHSSDAFVKDRAKIILFSSRGLYPKQIAEKISCDTRKVRCAIKTFNQEGLKALEKKKAKGAVPKFTETDKKIILMHFAKMPKDFGYHFTTWTLPRFRKHLIEKNVVDSICIETVRQLLVGAGAKLNKSKRWQYSPDKNFLKRKGQ